MKKLFVFLSVAVFASLVATTPSFAQPFAPGMCDDGGTPVPCLGGVTPEVYNAINKVFDAASVASPAYTSNIDANVARYMGVDHYWKDLSGGKASNLAFISLTAANTNTLGVFPFGAPGAAVDVVPSATGFDFLGSGTFADPFPGGVNPLAAGDFGFSLKSVAPGGGTTDTWYSDPALNSDGYDHMLSYYLPELGGSHFYVDLDGPGGDDPEKLYFSTETWLLAWEDKPLVGSDKDYNDAIFLVTKVTPVPEPMSMLLLGGGLAGLVSRRKKIVS